MSAPSEGTKNVLLDQSEAADKNIKSTEMSATKIDIKQIAKMPALLGEVDVIKTIQ